ncbi:hypothetical protein [Cupriavidus necator]
MRPHYPGVLERGFITIIALKNERASQGNLPSHSPFHCGEKILRCAGPPDRLAALLDDLLALADELSQSTIDRIMGMSDADLAAAVLSGSLRLPQR